MADQHAPSRPPALAPASSIDPVRVLRENVRLVLLAGVLGIAMGIGLHTVLLRTSPKYTASVLYEMKAAPDTASGQVKSVGAGGVQEMTYFINTEVQKMRSQTVLYNAVQNRLIRQETVWKDRFLDDKGFYNPDKALLGIEKIVSARSNNESNIVQLNASARNPDDAKKIVDAVAEQYEKLLRDGFSREIRDQVGVLTENKNNLQNRLIQSQESQDAILRTHNLPTLQSANSAERENLRTLLPEKRNTQSQIEVTEAVVSRYKEMLGSGAEDGLIQDFPESIRLSVQNNHVIRQYDMQLGDLRTNREAEADRLGENHRSIERFDGLIASVESERASAEQRLMEEDFLGLISAEENKLRALGEASQKHETEYNDLQTKLTDMNKILKRYNDLTIEIRSLTDRLAKAEQQLAETQAFADRSASQRVQRIENSKTPKQPDFPKIAMLVPASTVCCIGFVIGIAFLRELAEQRVRGPQDLRSLSRPAPCIGLVPEISEDPSRPASVESAVLDHPRGVIAEAIRHLRSVVFKVMPPSDAKTLLVMSSAPESGGTTIASALARSTAASERSVLVIDANFPRPSLHDSLGAPAKSPGLSDLLTGHASFEECLYPTDGGVTLLPVGSDPARTGERLVGPAMSRVLEDARSRFDMILLDAPPATVSSDAMHLAGLCDASLLIVRGHRDKRGLVQRLVGQLSAMPNHDFIGIALSRVRTSTSGYYRKNFRAMHKYGVDTGHTQPPAAPSSSIKETAPVEPSGVA